MSDATIICGGQSPAANTTDTIIKLDLSQEAKPAHRIDFDADKMRARFADELPDVIADALELAVYVFTADRLVTRQSSTSAEIGSGWERRLTFSVPVRCPDIWRRPEVSHALVDVLTFLSGDRLSFDFQQARGIQSPEPFLGFGDPTAHVIRPDLVMLFSGGLDSLAGVASEVIGAGKSAVLVTHQSANTIVNHQNELASAITRKCRPKQLYYAPVRVRRGTDPPKEHSQRLRSFLFASLGMAYAQMFGRNSVHFFENGITSFNLPVADHVLGTRASRTTHPRVLAGFSRLFSLLLDTPVTFENPFLWQTKTDIVATIARHGCSDLIGMTTSCASVRNYSMTGFQCGVCSQCVERRLAILATGQEEHEPAYERDLFRDSLERSQDRRMVLGHVRRAERFAKMSEHAFLANYGQIFRTLSSIGGPAREVASRIVDLHRRYGETVTSVIDGRLRQIASLDGFANLPGNSLLGMITTTTASSVDFVDPVEREPKPSVQAARDPPAIQIPRVVLAIDRDKKRIAFDDGPSLTRKSYALVSRLAEQHRSDMAAGLERQKIGFVSSVTLVRELGTKTDHALRQLAKRTRRSIETQFQQATGYRLDTNDVIESRNWEGYRLNPWVLLVNCDQIRNPEKKVTDRRTSRHVS